MGHDLATQRWLEFLPDRSLLSPHQSGHAWRQMIGTKAGAGEEVAEEVCVEEVVGAEGVAASDLLSGRIPPDRGHSSLSDLFGLGKLLESI